MEAIEARIGHKLTV